MGSVGLAMIGQAADSRDAPSARKPDRKLALVDRLSLRISTKRRLDGLWLVAREDQPQPGLRRVEDALRLMKRHDPLHYSRVLQNLERVWIRLLPVGLACYKTSAKACLLDERFVLAETTTLELVASTIIHEATHARLERWGISHDENRRSRIEAICLRRELNFVAKLPHSQSLHEDIARSLEWCVGNPGYFSDESFEQHHFEGAVEVMRYLNLPDWLVRFLSKGLLVRSGARRLVERFAGWAQR